LLFSTQVQNLDRNVNVMSSVNIFIAMECDVLIIL
jgi:hypothetical protein